jgi:2,3-bisphosphoglycerate-dependent phosphoglycerate mutase
MPTLVLVKNGETITDLDQKFSGWTDSDLSEQGKLQSILVGKKLKDSGITFDIAYTSVLKQDICTVWYVLEGMNFFSLDTFHDWRLNSRHFGAMEGLNISEISNDYGVEQFHLWLNTFDAKPPQLAINDIGFTTILNDSRYTHLQPSELPIGESILDTTRRTLTCWNDRVALALKQDANILCVANETNLKGLIMFLDKLLPDDFGNIITESQNPIMYELDSELRVMRKSFL